MMPLRWRMKAPGNAMPYCSRLVSGTVVLRIPNSRITVEPGSDSKGMHYPSAPEIREDRRRVVTSRREPKSGLTNFIQAALQLDELHLAVRSPVREAEKDEHRARGLSRSRVAKS